MELIGKDDWRLYANCKGTDIDMFPNEKDDVALAAAKAVCSGCVVIYDCLDYALSADETYGVWGGTTATERKPIKKAV